MKNFYQTQIFIPKFDNCFFAGKNIGADMYPIPVVRLIVYYDSTVCTTCKISEIWNWQEVVEHAKALDFRFQLMFIIAPPKDKIEAINEALITYPFECPVYMDYERIFYNSNKNLPSNSFLHTFLLDKNNKVVLIGDPLLDNELWDLYKKKIDALLSEQTL